MSTQQPHDQTIDPQTAPPSARPVGHQGTRVDVKERPAFAVDGFLALALSLLLFAGGIWLIIGGAIVSVIAFRIMIRIGRLPEPRRWFA